MKKKHVLIVAFIAILGTLFSGCVARYRPYHPYHPYYHSYYRPNPGYYHY